MNTIKNIDLLKGIPSADIEKLNQGAEQHKRFSNITFKIIKIFGDEVHVRTEQGKSLAGNYADSATLVTRTRELFSNVLPGRVVYVHPIAYTAPVVDVVTPKWIEKKMYEKGVKARDIIKLTGIEKSQISKWLSGEVTMTPAVKSMFYIAFESNFFDL